MARLILRAGTRRLGQRAIYRERKQECVCVREREREKERERERESQRTFSYCDSAIMSLGHPHRKPPPSLLPRGGLHEKRTSRSLRPSHLFGCRLRLPTISNVGINCHASSSVWAAITAPSSAVTHSTSEGEIPSLNATWWRSPFRTSIESRSTRFLPLAPA